MKLPGTDELIRIVGAVAVTVAVVGLATTFFMWVLTNMKPSGLIIKMRKYRNLPSDRTSFAENVSPKCASDYAPQ
jgi:hypothetical protein